MGSNKWTRHLWFFEYYDFDLITTYLNDKANRGEALEYIGLNFASYKKTKLGEYEYNVDYIENGKVDSEEFEQYKNTWMSNGWEYVDFYHGVVIYRCKKQDGCLQAPVNLEMIRYTILNKLKKQDKSTWLKSMIWIVAMLYICSTMGDKVTFGILLAIQLLNLDSFFSYLSLRKKSKQGFEYQIDQTTANSCILKRQVICGIIKILAMLLYALLLATLIFNHHLFMAKIMALVVMLLIGLNSYDAFKRYNQQQEYPVDMESKKGRWLKGSMVLAAITVMIISFILIDRLQPKWDVVKECPPMSLVCNNKSYDVEYDYGKWNYAISNGISTGYEEEFRLPKPNDITWFDRSDEDTIGISMVNKPDKMEVRYWSKHDFNKLKSYDKGYQEIPILNGSFTAVNEDVVYVVYAEWEREYYDGVGYYVFTLKGE